MHRSLVRSGVAAAVAFALFQLGGCGGGGSSSASSSTPTVTATSVNGTVATGSAVVGATVTLTDATGAQATATTNTQGAYTISVKGMTAPFLIVATDATGISAPLVSVLAKLPNGTAPAVANVTTLTTAIAAMLTASGNPLDLASTTALAKVTLPSVQIATITLDTMLAKILTQNGIQTAGFDPIGTAFTPNHTGADAVIDTVSVVSAANGGLVAAVECGAGHDRRAEQPDCPVDHAGSAARGGELSGAACVSADCLRGERHAQHVMLAGHRLRVTSKTARPIWP